MSQVSQAKIVANRRNSLKSTGPRTPRGKARVALNRMVHGLYATRIISVEETGEAFEAIRRQLISEWRPASVLEAAMIDQIAELLWRRRRVAAVEATLLEGKIYTRLPDASMKVSRDVIGMLSKQMASPNSAVLRAQVYQSRIDRGVHQALAELRKLQVDRRLRDAELPTKADKFELEVKNDGSKPPIGRTPAPARR